MKNIIIVTGGEKFVGSNLIDFCHQEKERDMLQLLLI